MPKSNLVTNYDKEFHDHLELQFIKENVMKKSIAERVGVSNAHINNADKIPTTKNCRQQAFAGLIFELEGASARIGYLTISKWGYEAILSLCNMRQVWSWSSLDFENQSAALPTCWFFMILFTVGYAFLSALLLRLVEHDKR